MASKFSKIFVKLSGVNLGRIYKCLNAQNVKVYDINRLDYKNIEFKIDFKDKNKVLQIAKSQNYEYAEAQNFGHSKISNFLKFRFGILIGVLVFLALNIFSSIFVWDIKIYGLDYVSKQKILDILSQNQICVGKMYKNQNLNDLETEITNNIEDISLCSIIKKGSCVIVNVKERLKNQEMTNMYVGSDIVAPQNLTITELVVSNGTAQKRVGDSVKKGEIIVAGFVTNSAGKKINCKANAVVKAKTWHTASVSFAKQKMVATKTGRCAKTEILTLFGMTFDVKNQSCDFDDFEEETKEVILSNNFLPFKMIVKTKFEVTREMVAQNFEEQKESILSECQKQAYKQVLDGEVVAKMFDTITEEKDEYIVTSYVEVNFELK